MALQKFDYKREHSRALYNTKGELMWSHSEEDELRCKEQGFTTPNYVRSEWPKQACHKKTGATRVVGKLDNTAEQNAAAVKALGPEWTLDHVPTPEPVAEAKPGTVAVDPNAATLMALMAAQMAEMRKRMDEQEQALIEMAASKPEPAPTEVAAGDGKPKK